MVILKMKSDFKHMNRDFNITQKVIFVK